MKIEEIINTGDDFLITFTPNWFERNLLGKKKSWREFRVLKNKQYTHFSNNHPVITRKGEVLPYNDEVSIKINNFLRSW